MISQVSLLLSVKARGGFRGGAGADASVLRDSTPADPKGPLCGTFSEIDFWSTGPKIFLKAPLAPIYTNFVRGSARQKKGFFCQHFPKVLKNCFFDLFFQKFACGAKVFAKTESFLQLEKSFSPT